MAPLDGELDDRADLIVVHAIDDGNDGDDVDAGGRSRGTAMRMKRSTHSAATAKGMQQQA